MGWPWWILVNAIGSPSVWPDLPRDVTGDPAELWCRVQSALTGYRCSQLFGLNVVCFCWEIVIEMELQKRYQKESIVIDKCASCLADCSYLFIDYHLNRHWFIVYVHSYENCSQAQKLPRPWNESKENYSFPEEFGEYFGAPKTPWAFSRRTSNPEVGLVRFGWSQLRIRPWSRPILIRWCQRWAGDTMFYRLYTSFLI